MTTVAIIAEYNPFHNGHAYQLHRVKELAFAEYAIVIMSPDFVQRGEPALLDKYTRTQMALENGADLVLELPVCFACGSAEYFAEGAVSILNALGCVDMLCFGSEAEDTKAFSTLADFFLHEPQEYQTLLQTFLKKGMTYPEARTKAFSICANETYSEFLSGPNNILGLEYVKALKKRSSAILPVPLKRQGNGYHNRALNGTFCSASAIRSRLHSAMTTDIFPDTELSPFMSASALHLLYKAWDESRLVTPGSFSSLLHYKLLSEKEYAHYLDVSEDLSDRIVKLLPEYQNTVQFVSLLKTRQLTEARIRRALLHILLNITKEDIERYREFGCAGYARALGFRKEAAPLLHRIKQTSSIPMITKLADSQKILSGSALQMLVQDISASHIYQLPLCARTGRALRNEYTRSPIIL